MNITNIFTRRISDLKRFNYIKPSPLPQTSHKTIHWIVLLGRVIGEGNCCICSDLPLILTFPPRGRNTTFLLEILRFSLYDKYNRGFGGKAPEDSSHLIIRVFLFRFCFFFFHRNKKEKVNISLSVGLAKPTYLFLIYISLFNQTLSPTLSPRGRNMKNFHLKSSL